MNYPIVQKFINKNRSGQALTPIGTVVHSTDDAGATDENEQSYFNNNSISASANAFIDWDSITETVPDNEVSWGSGPTSNHKFLQVELCIPASHDVAKFNEVWNRAVWYFAYKFINKLKINTITKDNLMSHAEVSAKWKETTHTDPVAYFNEYGKTVDNFRAAVQAEINNQTQPQESISYAGYVQNIGLQQFVKEGEVSGTVGQSLRLEGLVIDYKGPGKISIDGHVENIGWQTLRYDGEYVGTMGQSLRLEAIKVHLEGSQKKVQVQAHAEGIGWMDWVNDNEIAGTVGRSLRLEAIKIRLI